MTLPPPPAEDLTLLLALAFAFAGGLILNLMPCVFPVLSIKVLGLVRQSGESRTRVRLHGLAYTVIRGWIAPVVRIQLTDERDRTPYWLTSSRRPEQLVDALGGTMHTQELTPEPEAEAWGAAAEAPEDEPRA